MSDNYADKEMALPFDLVYRLGYDRHSIDRKDFLEELFKGLLFEMSSRMSGAKLLLNEDVGSKLDKDSIGDVDFISEDIDADDIIFNKECQIIALKRFEALQTFHDAIMILYKMFYNSNLKDLENLIQKHERGW